MKDKTVNRTFRLSPELEKILVERAKELRVDPSEYLRQLIARDGGICPLCGREVEDKKENLKWKKI